jgi:tetrapyrrole methylase family protein/MazG family protein/ATP diphosphatase
LNSVDQKDRALIQEFMSLMEVLRRLRAPDGCPWDREQTPETIKKYILEEAHELTEAVEEGWAAETCEELGDLFFLLLFLADLYEEQGEFTLKDSMEKIREKMIRRHPHIFGDVEVSGSADVIANWQAIKAREAEGKGKRKSALGDLPRSLPSLQRAFRMGERASRVGFDWQDSEGVMEKLQEEIRELEGAIHQESTSRVEEEVGDLLFTAANLSRKLGVNPEDALKKALDKFSRRFHELEDRVAQSGRQVSDLTPEELDLIWEKVKD